MGTYDFFAYAKSDGGGMVSIMVEEFESCGEKRFKWVMTYSNSCGCREGGYTSKTPKDALEKGLAFASEKNYEIVEVNFGC
jgi:hypothetical protein